MTSSWNLLQLELYVGPNGRTISIIKWVSDNVPLTPINWELIFKDMFENPFSKLANLLKNHFRKGRAQVVQFEPILTALSEFMPELKPFCSESIFSIPEQMLRELANSLGKHFTPDLLDHTVESEKEFKVYFLNGLVKFWKFFKDFNARQKLELHYPPAKNKILKEFNLLISQLYQPVENLRPANILADSSKSLFGENPYLQGYVSEVELLLREVAPDLSPLNSYCPIITRNPRSPTGFSCLTGIYLSDIREPFYGSNICIMDNGMNITNVKLLADTKHVQITMNNGRGDETLLLKLPSNELNELLSQLD
jgi:hypothetical protein